MSSGSKEKAPKKKYSGALCLNNDEIYFSNEDASDSKSNSQQRGGRQQNSDSAIAETDGRLEDSPLPDIPQNNELLNMMSSNYFMYPNNSFQQLFPTISVPMNMNGMQMMPYFGLGGMMYPMSMGENQDIYGPKYIEFMKLPAEKIIENFDEYVTDQQGCKFLQARLECEKDNEVLFSGIFEILLKSFEIYSKDQFANYLCQKFIELCSPEQLAALIDLMLPNLIKMSNSSHGTRVVQKMVETVSDPALVDKMIGELKGNVLELVYDPNGSHVVQKAVTHFDARKCNFIFEEIILEGEKVCKDKQGCCVVQKCGDSAIPDQKRLLVDSVVKNCRSLIDDKYGNYVIQYVLSMDDFEEQKNEIVDIINQEIIDFCYFKCSSNVIEKCIKLGLSKVTNKLLELIDKNDDALTQMLSDQFANYVLQTLLVNTQDHKNTQSIIDKINTLAKTLKDDDIAIKAIIKLSRTFDIETPQGRGPRRDGNQSQGGYRGGRKKRGTYQGGYKKRGNYRQNPGRRGGFMQNPNMMFPMLDSQSPNQFSMNLNFNVNLNYNNQTE